MVEDRGALTTKSAGAEELAARTAPAFRITSWEVFVSAREEEDVAEATVFGRVFFKNVPLPTILLPLLVLLCTAPLPAELCSGGAKALRVMDVSPNTREIWADARVELFLATSSRRYSKRIQMEIRDSVDVVATSGTHKSECVCHHLVHCTVIQSTFSYS